MAAALSPFCFVGLLPLRLGGVERGLHRRRVAGYPERRLEGGTAALGIFRLMRALLVRNERRVARRQAEIGSPLEDVKMLRLPRDDRDRLDARRARPDYADPQSGEIHACMRP